MPAAHRQSAEHYGAPLADPVTEPAAKDRREIDEAGVEAEDLRCQRLRRHRPERIFERCPECGEPNDILNMAWQQQLVDHVEDQQGRHPIIREALPSLGEGKESETLGMPEEGAA